MSQPPLPGIDQALIQAGWAPHLLQAALQAGNLAELRDLYPQIVADMAGKWSEISMPGSRPVWADKDAMRFPPPGFTSDEGLALAVIEREGLPLKTADLPGPLLGHAPTGIWPHEAWDAGTGVCTCWQRGLGTGVGE